MNLRTTRAVVSKTMKMSDSSKLVTLITENNGLVKVMAKGARRPQSRYGAALESITLISSIYYFRDSREIQSLSGAEIIEPFENIKDDLKKLSAAFAIVEIAQSLTASEDPGAGTFDILVDSLEGLECGRTKDAEKHLWRFVLRVLSAAGYKPSLDKCVVCGKKPHERSVFFSLQDGGLVCSCAGSEGKFGFNVSPGALMVMKNLMKGDVGELPKLKIDSSQSREIEKITLQFLSYHTGTSRQPRSLSFMRKMEADKKRQG